MQSIPFTCHLTLEPLIEAQTSTDDWLANNDVSLLQKNNDSSNVNDLLSALSSADASTRQFEVTSISFSFKKGSVYLQLPTGVEEPLQEGDIISLPNQHRFKVQLTTDTDQSSTHSSTPAQEPDHHSPSLYDDIWGEGITTQREAHTQTALSQAAYQNPFSASELPSSPVEPQSNPYPGYYPSSHAQPSNHYDPLAFLYSKGPSALVGNASASNGQPYEEAPMLNTALNNTNMPFPAQDSVMSAQSHHAPAAPTSTSSDPFMPQSSFVHRHQASGKTTYLEQSPLDILDEYLNDDYQQASLSKTPPSSPLALQHDLPVTQHNARYDQYYQAPEKPKGGLLSRIKNKLI